MPLIREIFNLPRSVNLADFLLHPEGITDAHLGLTEGYTEP